MTENMLTRISTALETWNIKPNRTQILRFVLSLALAVLLWGWVTELQDPRLEKAFLDVPITSPDLPDELLVVSALPQATVEIEGPESRIGPVNRSMVEVTLDTSDITSPGTYQVDVVANVPNTNSVSVNPSEVTVQVDRRVSRLFPLTVSTAPATDELHTIALAVPEVSQVTVSGPETVVSRVTEVILPVTLDQQVSDFTAQYSPYAVDEAGQQISDVEILPASVRTQVTVESRGKPVSVIPNVTGTPAEGYAVQQRRTIPDTIIVDGPAELLDDLLFINTEPIDITGATQSISTQVAIAGLPEGVTIVEPESGIVEVRIAVEDTTASTQPLNDLPVEVVGLAEGHTASVQPGSISIEVSAPQSLLQTMEPDDIRVFVNVEGLGPGEYQLEPVVTVPQGATWIGSDPVVVTVVITEGDPEASSATPPATPAPS